MRRINPVPGRRGWHLGDPVKHGSETRAPLEHVESRYIQWVYGITQEERVRAAQVAIDEVYERRWTLMAELIEQGDFHGPNVKSQDANLAGA